jgi:hypothetical protein
MIVPHRRARCDRLIVVLMSMAIIGVRHVDGNRPATSRASATPAWPSNVDGLLHRLDGQSFLYGDASRMIRDSKLSIPKPEAGKIENWTIWPYAMITTRWSGSRWRSRSECEADPEWRRRC